MIDLVQALQLVSGMLWLLPAVVLAPGVWRTWMGRPTVLDVLSSPMFFVCCIFVAGAFRWLLWDSTLQYMTGEELTFWAGIYVVSSLCAIGVLWSYWLAKGR